MPTVAYGLASISMAACSPPATAGTDRLFVLFGSEPGPGPEDPSWDQFWASQHGWKRELALICATHISFAELETLMP